ncbi:putative proline-rich receptor-like protein kinase PERK11 isoform X2 [Eucalyptus grandis]|uniref:putative proline-rich receptor-like protein kinase PERK11 isoform X2 n=1 Tax=Eucalyptus grandis TaxID=71139 RepID=UPI00192E7A7C|nr:putative proline-rich receptor-like protein kinase PERK11 isoform X2 [Eucalyptus grandis]
MGLEAANSSSPGETVIVVMDANRSRGNVQALEWALRHVARRGHTVLVLGVFCEIGKRASCFPFHMGEKLEPLGEGEVDPTELEEEIAKKREEYKSYLQPFYRHCKKNEVKLESKIAAGFCRRKLTVDEAQSCKTCWIILDSHLKKDKTYIYAHVGCNLALVKGKDVVTLMPSKVILQESSSLKHRRVDDALLHNDPITDNQEDKSVTPPPKTRCWYPLAWRTGFPRSFTESELEVITSGFSKESIVQTLDNVQVYQGQFQETPVLVNCFSQNDERFWSMLRILSRVRHRNILNIVGYCFTDSSMSLLFDFLFMGTLEINLQNNNLAEKISWKARWYIAVEIGACLRYLHEECVDGLIVHLFVCSSHVIYPLGGSAMLANFMSAKCLKDSSPKHNQSLAHCLNLQADDGIAIDVHDYGIFLLELITGRSAQCFLDPNKEDLIDWALPEIENGSLSEVKDPRLTDTTDDRLIHHMAQAALLCLHDFNRGISMSEVLAVVRGHQMARPGA